MKSLERVRFIGGWDHGEDHTFTVTLQLSNIPTVEDRELLLRRLGDMMQWLLVDTQKKQAARNGDPDNGR